MALNNIKDPVTTVTMSYRIIPKPEPPAVDEITTDEAPADTSEPPADGAARRRRILYTKMQNTTTDDVSEKQPDLQSRKSRNLVEDKLIDQHTELVQKSIPPELLDCEQTNEQLHEACEEAFQAPEYVNDHFNCIEKFGMKRGPFFCIQTEGFVMDSFEYNLKHKYSCLRRFTQLVMDPDVQWCYEKTVNYLIE